MILDDIGLKTLDIPIRQQAMPANQKNNMLVSFAKRTQDLQAPSQARLLPTSRLFQPPQPNQQLGPTAWVCFWFVGSARACTRSGDSAWGSDGPKKGARRFFCNLFLRMSHQEEEVVFQTVLSVSHIFGLQIRLHFRTLLISTTFFHQGSPKPGSHIAFSTSFCRILGGQKTLLSLSAFFNSGLPHGFTQVKLWFS